MNKYLSTLLGLIFFLICGCLPHKEYIAKVKLLKLKEADIYDADMVYDVIFDAEEQNIDSSKKVSQQLFLKGIDAYKNKKNNEEAVSLFTKSILTFPNAKTYYELGNAKLECINNHEDLKDVYLKDAIKAYEVAEALKFQPLSNVYYKEACTYNMMNDDSRNDVYNELYQAFLNGFSDTLLLQNDKYLKSFITTEEYKKMMFEIALEKKRKNNESLFDIYVESFPNIVSSSFEISLEKVDMKDYRQSINYDFAKFVPEMQNSSFGRDVSNDFIFVAKVAQTDNYIALIYSSVNYYGEFMQPVHTKLVTYNTNGDIISSLLFAGQFTPEKIKIGRIDANNITLQDYKRIWKYPIDKKSFDENTVEKFEGLGKATFTIDDMGTIKEVSVPSDYTDTISLAKNKLTAL